MSIKFEDHTEECLSLLDRAGIRILTIWGEKIAGWAAKRCPVGTVESTGKKGYRGGTLRDSIAFDVDEDAKEVSVGSDVDYAPYVELGTGPHFTPPPEWETFDTPEPSGLGHNYMEARPFLRPSVEKHKSKLKKIAENELENA